MTPAAETEIARIVDELASGTRGGRLARDAAAAVLSEVDQPRPPPGLTRARTRSGSSFCTSPRGRTRCGAGWRRAGRPACRGRLAGPAKAHAQAWRDAVAALEEAHRALVAAVQTLAEANLFEPTNDPRDRETGQGCRTTCCSMASCSTTSITRARSRSPRKRCHGPGSRLLRSAAGDNSQFPTYLFSGRPLRGLGFRLGEKKASARSLPPGGGTAAHG